MTFPSFLRAMGANIASVRKTKSINQKQAADRSQISYRYYQSIEAGVANITLATLYRLAEILDVHPASLLEPQPKSAR